jgi:hypothetical protein
MLRTTKLQHFRFELLPVLSAPAARRIPFTFAGRFRKYEREENEHLPKIPTRGCIISFLEPLTLQHRWRRIVYCCIFVAIPGSLYAVNGAVLIDQPHALAGNITPGDAPGFPVTISEPGNYRLTGNLTVPDANTTAIDIKADDVTLDLKGFGIIGPVVRGSAPTACPAAGTATSNKAEQHGRFGISVVCPSSIVGNTLTGNTEGGA